MIKRYDSIGAWSFISLWLQLKIGARGYGGYRFESCLLLTLGRGYQRLSTMN